jgi:hypothetical protein
MALLLEGIAPKTSDKLSQSLFGSKLAPPSASPPRSPFQATTGNSSMPKISVPNAEYMNYLEQRAMSPPPAARKPVASPVLYGVRLNESPKQNTQVAEQLSQFNVSA